MRGFDFSSWQTIVSTLVGIVLVSLVAVGIRLLVMQSVQQRRERQNRQINERLRTLIAAYKALGGSFTGDLSVDPRHLRDVRMRDPRDLPGTPATEGPAGRTPVEAALDAIDDADTEDGDAAARPIGPGSDRRRRMRDAVEAALSDVILLGTEEQVRLAAQAAREMVAGRRVHLAELVVSLRTFIRDVLDLEPIAAGLEIPAQGPVRPGGGAGRSGGGGGPGATGGRGGGGGGGGTGAGLGMGMGLGGMGASRAGESADVAASEGPEAGSR